MALSTFGRFELHALLGRGGAGDVWKARDPSLDRWIALKILRRAVPEDIARFKREAQTAGALDHPNLARIYEVGEHDAKPYIAMQLVDGRTLKGWKGPERDAVRLVRDAARACAAAHAHGIVHRDLKPENLMLEGDHLYVMDFGLARSIEGESGISLAGTIVGTPSYMSPEQSRGAHVDARADVYSLGATLYELVEGRPPFAGANAFATIRYVQENDPDPPRSCDTGLRAVIMKCLEKDPAARYASADEFAQELDRWLAGEAVTAQPTGTIRILARKLGRRRLPIALAAVGIVVAIVVAAVLVRRTGETQKDVEEARRSAVLGMRTRARECVAAALDLRRAGNLDGMKRFADEARDICMRVAGTYPDLAEPHLLLGRMHRAMMRFDDARREQDLALAREPGNAEARYERALLLAREYAAMARRVGEAAQREEGERLHRLGGGQIRPGETPGLPSIGRLLQTDPAAVELRTRLLDDLDRVSGLGEGPTALAHALRAWARGTADMLPLLEDAARFDDRVEESFELLAGVHILRNDPVAALAVITHAVERDRGYVPTREYRITLLIQVSAVESDPAARLREAIAECDRVLKLQPGNAEALLSRAVAGSAIGWREMVRSGDAEAAYNAALVDFDAAVAAGVPRARTQRGRALMDWATARQERRLDGSALFARALEDLKDANDVESLKVRGHGVASWYAHESLPLDAAAEEAIRRAIDDLGAALRLNPGNASAWVYRGTARQNLANKMLTGRPEDARRLLEDGINDFAEALRVDPSRYEGWMGRGVAWLNVAALVELSGGDPVPYYESSEESLTGAIKVLPSRDEPWARRAVTRFTWGDRIARSEPERAYELFDEAAQDCTEAIKRNARRPEPWMTRSAARANLGWRAAHQGGDAAGLFQEALSDAETAIKLAPRQGLPYRYRATARYTRALALRSKEDARQAVRDFKEAVRLSPELEPGLRHLLQGAQRLAGSE